jgi:eukaryotic-like serine/threonine-protein kinase
VALALGNLGNTHNARGRHAEALAALERALAIHRRLGDPPYMAQSIEGIGSALRGLGRPTEALERYREALVVREATFGADHVFVAYALVGVGQTLVALGRVDEALAPLERAVQLRRGEGVDPGELGEAAWQLAQALDAATTPDRDRALALAREARDRYAEVLAAGHPQLGAIDAWIRGRL